MAKKAAESAGAGKKRKVEAEEPVRPSENMKTLEAVVGPYVYQTWVLMLRALVPEGRTHRLGPLVAAMLQYAFIAASEADADELAKNPIAAALIASEDMYDPDEMDALVGDEVKQLFKDAGVKYKRRSKGGEDYTILDTAYQEYIHWFDMPWED